MRLRDLLKTKRGKALLKHQEFISLRDRCRRQARYCEEQALKYWTIAHPEKYNFLSKRKDGEKEGKQWIYKEGENGYR